MSRSTARQTPGQAAPQADPVLARPHPFALPAPAPGVAPQTRLGHSLSDFSVFPPEQVGTPIQRKAAGEGLPDDLRAGIEGLAGMDMGNVNVHNGAGAPALGALAYAQGAGIHMAAGQEQHLPHEAWHVAQQAQGRVAAGELEM